MLVELEHTGGAVQDTCGELVIHDNSSFLLFPEYLKKFNVVKEAYRKLKEVPDKALASSGYSEINLAKLFQAFSSLK